MDEVLSAAPRTAVLEHLDRLDMLVARADEQSRAALAGTEITRLAAAWRTLLTLHQPDEQGRCPQCSGWRRGRRFSCSVWMTAHEHLIAADRLSSPAGVGHATAAGRSTVTTPAAC